MRAAIILLVLFASHGLAMVCWMAAFNANPHHNLETILLVEERIERLREEARDYEILDLYDQGGRGNRSWE